MAIRIPISADFQPGDVQRQIKAISDQIRALGNAAAQANKQKFEPVSIRSKDDLVAFVKQMEKLMRVQGELRNRMKATGQSGMSPLAANWNLLYSDPKIRNQKIQQMLGFLGNGFEDLPPAARAGAGRGGRGNGAPPPNIPPHPNGGHRNGHNPVVQAGANILQSGLRAAGPVGGVAAGAVGQGMSGGFGAGLAGLMGGALALGVGKIVGSIVEKLDQAEQNNIAYDKLKRTLGDVNVSFTGLKTLIQSNANNLAITFDEAAKLSTQFAKLGNLSAAQHKSLGGELSTGVGFSRGFGMDPSQGMGFFGSMRGVGATTTLQGTRRLAILIGETIGKSKAFAKADEVLEGIANFTTAQTRQALSAANVSGYAGTFSALAGSGIAGLDVAGVTGMLGKVNASLMMGGSKGEASQFMSSMVANRMGLNPIQSAIMREGGAFATNDQMFGEGSAAAMYGVKGPGGSKTFLEETLATLRSKYHDPGMLAMATANHLGIGINQAMALLKIKPNRMGDIQRGLSASGVDIANVNGAGIANLAKIYSGSDEERKGIAQSLFSRTGDGALSSTEVDRLRSAMASGDVEQQKKILTELVATRDQEATQGSDIRDSKNILDNIKTALADKMIPLVQEMRHGIMYLAGVGKDGLTPQDIQEQVIRAESEGKANAIKQEYQTKINVQADRIAKARIDSVGIPTEAEALLPPDEMNAAMYKRQQAAEKVMAEAEAEIGRINAEMEARLRVNENEAGAQIDAMRTSMGGSFGGGFGGLSGGMDSVGMIGGSGTLRGSNSSSGAGRAPVNWQPGTTPGVGEEITDPDQRKRLSAFLEAIAASEGANYDTIVGGGTFTDFSDHPRTVGLTTKDGPSTAAGRYQITKTTWDAIKGKLGLDDFSPESQDRAAIELLRRRGALQDVLNGDIDSALSKLGNEWQGLPTGTSSNQGHRSREWFDARYNEAYKDGVAQIPAGDSYSQPEINVNVKADDLVVRHENGQGETVGPSQSLKTSVGPPRPSGTGR